MGQDIHQPALADIKRADIVPGDGVSCRTGTGRIAGHIIQAVGKGIHHLHRVQDGFTGIGYIDGEVDIGGWRALRGSHLLGDIDLGLQDFDAA